MKLKTDRIALMKSDILLPEILPNIATMLLRNEVKYKNNIVYQEKDANGHYQGITWKNFVGRVKNIAANLKDFGFGEGDKMIIFSRNNLDMLALGQAVKASGGIAVPIFAGFYQETADLLIKHCRGKYLAVEGRQQLNRISTDLPLKHIFSFDNQPDKRFKNLHPFSHLLTQHPNADTAFNLQSNTDDICLNMYTSGTTGNPKCVQLTHGNILSQQAALSVVWDIDHTDRFLSYLPWHHSFGGIFEKYTALFNGACISLESSYGKNPDEIFANWKKVKPTVFFSIPKIYKALIELTRQSSENESLFFKSGLKFIFTAAAPLPENLSLEFQKRGIAVIEGWGLTETSPCCTLTDPAIKRVTGVVGKPIPGVAIRIDKDSEIQVSGPNVMHSYFDNDKANEKAFTTDGWFRTGDIGKFTKTGLQLITRKDRIFKLSNGEKVIPTELEKMIEKKCHLVSYALVTGSGEEYPVALIFPNKKLMQSANQSIAIEGCACPKSLDELSRCMKNCLNDTNCDIAQKFARIRLATIIDDELSIESNTLTPSMKMAAKQVVDAYKVHIKRMYSDEQITEEAYLVKLENLKA